MRAALKLNDLLFCTRLDDKKEHTPALKMEIKPAADFVLLATGAPLPPPFGRVESVGCSSSSENSEQRGAGTTAD